MAPAARLFEIRDGRLWMDGRQLPPDAIPPGLDLTGVMLQLELVGPVIPVVEVDGEAERCGMLCGCVHVAGRTGG